MANSNLYKTINKWLKFIAFYLIIEIFSAKVQYFDVLFVPDYVLF